jgi:hypothetical protein
MTTELPISVNGRAGRTPASPGDGSEELLHQLRNILAGMTYGIQALGDAHSRGDEQAAAYLQQAMVKQVDMLRDAVAEAARVARVRGS